mgnify:FL=1
MNGFSSSLVVGLGNPGDRYENTRHNAGFLVVDRLRDLLDGTAENAAWNGAVSRCRCGGQTVALLKPLTYMNRSGDAVSTALETLDLSPADLIVVVDCIDLPLGRLRLRPRGSSGGHRGVESIIQTLGTRDFARLRVGVGRPDRETVVDFVLSEWLPDERPLVRRVVDTACEAVQTALQEGTTEAMNRFNGVRLASTETDSEPKKEESTE